MASDQGHLAARAKIASKPSVVVPGESTHADADEPDSTLIDFGTASGGDHEIAAAAPEPPVSISRSAAILRSAAQAGDAVAQFWLAVRHTTGAGVRRSDAEAVKWYRLAARQGHSTAQFNLGVRYSKGRGIEKNDAQAVVWYRRAANQGYAPAQYNLGLNYAKGRGVRRDDVLAHMWTSLAAASGDKEAGRNQNILAKRTTPRRVARAMQLTRAWKPARE